MKAARAMSALDPAAHGALPSLAAPQPSHHAAPHGTPSPAAAARGKARSGSHVHRGPPPPGLGSAILSRAVIEPNLGGPNGRRSPPPLFRVRSPARSGSVAGGGGNVANVEPLEADAVTAAAGVSYTHATGALTTTATIPSHLLGGDQSLILTLKSDLIVVQSEIDRATNGAGVLTLQPSLAALNYSAVNAIDNHFTIRSLMLMLLAKVNELAAVCGVAERRANGSVFGATTDVSVTALRQSRVGQLVDYFHNHYSLIRASGGAAAAHSSDATPLASQWPSGAAHRRTSSVGPAGGTAPDPSVENPRGGGASFLAANAQGAVPSASRRSGAGGALAPSLHTKQSSVRAADSAIVLQTDFDLGPMPIVVTDGDGGYLGATSSSAAANSDAGARHQAAPRGSTADGVNLLRTYSEVEALRDRVRLLEKQVSFFTHLERHVHAVDTFDAGMKQCFANPALAESGVDVKGALAALARRASNSAAPGGEPTGAQKLAAIVPPYVTRQASPGGTMFKPSVQGSPSTSGAVLSSDRPAAVPAATNARAAVVDVSGGAAPASPIDGATPNGAAALGNGARPEDVAAIAALRSLSAYQSALVAHLLDELRSARADVDTWRDKLREIEGDAAMTASLPSPARVAPVPSTDLPPQRSPSATMLGDFSLRSTSSPLSKSRLTAAVVAAADPQPVASPSRGNATTAASAAAREVGHLTVPALMKRVRTLEAALSAQQDQMAFERESNALRNERLTTMLTSERARTSTPWGASSASVAYVQSAPAGLYGGLSRPTSRALVPLESGSNEGGPPVTAYYSHRAGSPLASTVADPTAHQQLAAADRPPSSGIPLLATRVEDIPAERERRYVKTINDQAAIIRDLTQRAPTPSTAGTMGYDL